MISLKIYILSVLLLFSGRSYHPVHVSVLNMEYLPEKSMVDLLFKVFTADLEFAIAHNFNVALNLGQPSESPEAEMQINKYLSATFRLMINNNYQPKIVSISKEISEDATWVHVSFPLTEQIHHFTIHNAIFMDLYQDQTNLLIITLNKKETGYRLDFYNREITLTN